MKILVVCLGNICRSPIAERVLQKMATEKKLPWHIESAGANRIHTGEAPHPLSQQVCKENSIDISQQRARDFIKEDLDRFDKIYVMADDVMHDVKRIVGSYRNLDKVDYFLNELYTHENKSVIDPWFGAIDGYYKVYNQIVACCEKIIARYS